MIFCVGGGGAALPRAGVLIYSMIPGPDTPVLVDDVTLTLTTAEGKQILKEFTLLFHTMVW